MSDEPMFTHRLTVRFRDCDAMGHVNHAVYFTYFEQARLAWYHSLGGAEAFPDVSTMVVHAECDYKAPAFMHEEVEIQVSLAALGRTSMTASYIVNNVASKARLAEGKTVSVTVDPRTHKPVPLPQTTKTILGALLAKRVPNSA
jgi:acyl-CoA thioester hydrolase